MPRFDEESIDGVQLRIKSRDDEMAANARGAIARMLRNAAERIEGGLVGGDGCHQNVQDINGNIVGTFVLTCDFGEE